MAERISAAQSAQDHEMVLTGEVINSDVVLSERNSLSLVDALALQHFIDRHSFQCKWLMQERGFEQRTP